MGHKSPKSSAQLRPQSGSSGKPGAVPTKGNKVQDTGAFKNPNAGIRGQKKQGGR